MEDYFLLIFSAHISFQSCNRRSIIDSRRSPRQYFFEIGVFSGLLTCLFAGNITLTFPYWYSADQKAEILIIQIFQ